MSKSNITLKDIEKKKESRLIVKEIEKFGIDESQKIDIILGIAMTLENVTALQEIAKIVKKFKFNINKEEFEDNLNNKDKTILT